MSWLHAVVDVPSDRQADAATFWGAALGWPVGPGWEDHPELRSFEPAGGGTPYVHLQRVDGPPRVHLDVESTSPEETVTRAVDLGATEAARSDRWTTLHSPGGLPFCVVAARQHERPEPVAHADGRRTRLVQVCVDSPSAVHDGEVAFWRELLAGRWVSSAAPEFAGKWHDDEDSPIQLLFQRLDEPTGPVRAHLDLGTDDVDAEVRRLVGLGATDVGPGRGWHVLRDPAGLLFCATGNSPGWPRHRDL